MNDEEIKAYASEIILGYVRDGDDLAGWEMYRDTGEDEPLSEEEARKVHDLIESDWRVTWPSDGTVTVTLPEADGKISPDGFIGDMWWIDMPNPGGFVQVWPDGIRHTDRFIEATNISVADVEHAGRVLLAVAAQMRTMKADFNGAECFGCEQG